MPKNIWDEEVPVSSRKDRWWVPPGERLEVDDPDDPQANALDDETGDDLDGWDPSAELAE